jgi:hypothetical protein
MLFSPLARVCSLSVTALPIILGLGMSLPVQAQIITEPSDDLRPLVQDTSLLSMQGGQRLMRESLTAVESQDYATAVVKLQQARQVFNQLSNFYQQLSTSFTGINNRLADVHRQRAVEVAEMRDQATYQLALVHQAQNQPDLSVPLLVQVIRSQNPTTDLGSKAYAQLVQLGFASEVEPPSGGTVSSTTLLSLQGGEQLMQESLAAVQSQDYATAVVKLQQARQVFNQLSNFYQQLSASFSGINNQLADVNRQSAVEVAEMRDQATYQLALVHRAQNQPELSVPLLIQVIRSQNPTTDLGVKAYDQLVQLGFVSGSSALTRVPLSPTAP